MRVVHVFCFEWQERVRFLFLLVADGGQKEDGRFLRMGLGWSVFPASICWALKGHQQETPSCLGVYIRHRSILRSRGIVE